MAGNHPVASSDPVVSSPPRLAGGDVQGRQGTMAVQAGGNSVGIEYVLPEDRPPTPPSNEERSGPWSAILSFFGMRKAAPVNKRPASVELQQKQDKPARHDSRGTIVKKPALPPQVHSERPFPFSDLPFELLCEVMAHVPPGDRHFFRDGSPLATTCKAFHSAINAVSAMAGHRDDDAVARRVSGMQWSNQVVPMVDALVNAKQSVRNWALPAVIRLTGSMSKEGRQKHIQVLLEEAKVHSSLWQLELMRHLAQWLPDTDGELLSLVTERALQFQAQNDAEHLARARVLAQLAQRTNPHNLSETIDRWETICDSVAAHPRNEDILTVRGLQIGYDHLAAIFERTFNCSSEGMLLRKLNCLYQAVNSSHAQEILAACTAEELVPRPAPAASSLRNPMRAYSTIMVRSIPQVDRLPSHMM